MRNNRPLDTKACSVALALMAASSLPQAASTDAAAQRAAIRDGPSVHLPAAALQQHVGFYSVGSQRLWVRLSGDRLMARPDGFQWARLIAQSPRRFALEGSALEIEFDARPGQRANVAALRKGQSVTLLMRAPDPSPPFASVPFYLRGSMNDWAATLAMEQTDLQQYVATLVLPAGAHEFKLGSSDWQAVDFGGPAPDTAVVPGHKALLSQRGANLVLNVERAGRYRFALDTINAAAPTITVTALP